MTKHLSGTKPSDCRRTLHVAAAQIHSGGTVDETLERLRRQVVAASAVGAEMILFSEGVLQGYDYDMTAEIIEAGAEPVDGPHCRRIAELARKFSITVVAGFFERDGDRFYNAMLVAPPAGPCWTARKFMLGEIERRANLTPGPKERPVLEINGVRAAIIICADGGIDGLHEDLRARRVDYRLCPTGGGGKIGDYLHESDLGTEKGRAAYEANRPRVFKSEAILDAKECPFTGFTSANALGPVGRQTCHQGHCMIVDNRRVMRAQIPGTIVLEHQQDQMIHAALSFPAEGRGE
jgi:predicted amidohydrolase